jgi:Zn-dependent protease with chaperone function
MAQRKGQRNRGRRSNDRGRGGVEAPVVLPPSAETSLFGFEVGTDEVEANLHAARKVAALSVGLPVFVGVTVVLGIALALFAGYIFVLLAVLLGVGAGAFVTHQLEQSATAATLELIGARTVEAAEAPRLANLVDAMVATVGLATPTLCVVDDDVINACAVGHGDSATLIVTSGLLEKLDLIALEGVVAHELAHLRRGDGHRGAVAVVAAKRGLGAASTEKLHRAAGHGRELRADQVGSASVRYPRGMATALSLCEQSGEPSRTSFFRSDAFVATRWLWFDPMVTDRSTESAMDNHDATSLRLAVLEEW